MRKSFWRFIKENLTLIAILICLSYLILCGSYFFSININTDSGSYLRAAREILRGNGFYSYPGKWFSIWPIGYPFLIAVTSFITQTEVYLASKILSVLIVWIIGFSLYKRFGRTAWAYALVMFNLGFVHLFYSSMSEIPFILGLIWFSFWTSDIITKDIVDIADYVKLTLAAIILFLLRYIGAFSLGVIGFLWIYNMYLLYEYKDGSARKRVMYLGISAAVSGFAMISYLLLNRKMTGYMTGYARYPVDNFRELLWNLFDSQLIEMSNFTPFFNIDIEPLALPLWFCFLAFVLYVIFHNLKAIKARDKNIITPMTFLVMGGIYWCSIVAMRFSVYFNVFSSRFLFPSSILLFIGFMGLLARHEKIKNFLVRFSGISAFSNTEKRGNSEHILTWPLILPFFLFVMVKSVLMTGLSSSIGYQKTTESLLNMYADIPDGSVVWWAEGRNIAFLDYLRDDVEQYRHVRPLADETPEAFFNRYGARKIFVYVPGMKKYMDDDLKSSKFVEEFFEQYRNSGETFIRIK